MKKLCNPVCRIDFLSPPDIPSTSYTVWNIMSRWRRRKKKVSARVAATTSYIQIKKRFVDISVSAENSNTANNICCTVSCIPADAPIRVSVFESSPPLIPFSFFAWTSSVDVVDSPTTNNPHVLFVPQKPSQLASLSHQKANPSPNSYSDQPLYSTITS